LEVSTSQQRAAQILNFIPMFIIMAGFIGGMQIATDSTAGRTRARIRSRPLLVNPAPRTMRLRERQVARCGARAFVSVLVTTMLCAKPAAVPAARGHGHPVPDRPRTSRRHRSARSLRCVCFTAALQAAVATLARSFKEAQSLHGDADLCCR
jgi:sodium transport system permease protein